MEVAPAPRAPAGPSGRALLRELLRRGPRSRTALSTLLDLSAPSLTRLSATLMAEGLLAESTAVSEPGTGRPARPLEVVPGALRTVGVNLTGDRATAVLTGLDAVVLARAEAPLRRTRPAVVAEVVADLVAGLGGTGAPHGPAHLVGVSLGGAVDGRQVLRAPFLGWPVGDPVPLADLVEEATRLPVVLDNDLVALTRGEHWFGLGSTLDRFALVTLGAGVGFGLVLHDRVVDGPDGGIGLLGHAPVGTRGRFCGLGHEGCAAAVLTTDALRRAAGTPDADTCLDLAVAGDRPSLAVVQEAGRAVGRLVGGICNVTQVTDVLLTGEGVRLAQVAAGAVADGLHESRDPLAQQVRLTVRSGDFGDYARGAAVSALQSWLAGDLAADPDPTTDPTAAPTTDRTLQETR